MISYGPLLALALILVSPIGLLAAQGQEPSPTPAVANAQALAIPQAAFQDEPGQGKDPFFPESKRRHRAAPVALAGQNPSVGLLGQLELKGISYGKTRLALINSLTLAAGEKGRLKLDDQRVEVHCLEIRDQSVLVSITGTLETKELQLRKGI